MSRGAVRVSLVFIRVLAVVWWLLVAGGVVAVTFIGFELVRGARGRVSLPMTFAGVSTLHLDGLGRGVGRPAVTGLSGTVEVTGPVSVGLAVLGMSSPLVMAAFVGL